MDDLFRFMMLRPANLPPPDEVKSITPGFVNQGAPIQEARRAAAQYVQSGAFVRSTFELAFARIANTIVSAIRTGPSKPADLADLTKKVTGKTPADLIADDGFKTEETRLADSLVAMKLLSSSVGGDAPAVARLVQGYDAVRQVADGRDPVILRALSYEMGSVNNQPRQQPGPSLAPASPSHDPREIVDQLDGAISTLSTIPASGFSAAQATAQPGHHASTSSAPAELRSDRPHLGSALAARAGGAVGSQPWILNHQTVAALPEAVRATLAKIGLDLGTTALPIVLNALHEQKVEAQRNLELSATSADRVRHQIGSAFAEINSSGYVGTPSGPLPAGYGSVRPVGIGDLLMVKQHVLRYEGGDLAHVENILKSEHLQRDTRRLERTETTVLQETETTKEEESDTQTTDRFSLKRETSDTIKTDSSFKAGVSVDAKYGPFVEVKANADFGTSTSAESSAKQASEFSKDVLDRSVSKLVERVLERRTTTTITEFEEKYSHGFDNTAGTGHISGFYQWIDKVMQAQVYNYGKRMLFDITVPEPGTNFILTQTANTDQGQSLTQPPLFTIRADEITEANYTIWAKNYDVTGLGPPPSPYATFSKPFDGVFTQDPHDTSKSDSIPIDPQYSAKKATMAGAWLLTGGGPAWWQVQIGTKHLNVFTDPPVLDMAGEVGSVGFAYYASEVEALSANIEIYCERTAAAFSTWQLKTHASITQGYQAKQQQYEQALAQAKAAAGTVIAGRNPDFNTRLVAGELRRQCLTLLTGQQFDGFGALELSAEGYAQPNLAATDTQMPYVRFFEQAFEWDRLVYFYYPYFWGWKPAWKNHMLLDDTDPAFGDFLRAGAARVVFPVRPGFEEAVVHYLETGEIWNGGPPPTITSPLYVPIIKEIEEATGAPGNEVPVGDPWLIHLPTTLVQLRPNNDLPIWKKVGEEWQPAN
jgi:hypothetical protein